MTVHDHDIQSFKEGFTDPFRYVPHPLVRKAARFVISDLDRRIKDGLLPEEVCEGFKAGKMLGILVCEPENPEIGPVYLSGFSGTVGGCSTIDGFVPPIFDLYVPEGEYRLREAEISTLNMRIDSIEAGSELAELRLELAEAERDRDEDLGLMKARMAISKRERDLIRCELSDPSQMSELIKESQFEKAELHRLKRHWEERISEIRGRLDLVLNEIAELKAKRASMSDALQRWIFEQYIVYNALGERISVWKLFSGQGLTPPGGTGECAAPKLLEHAYKMGLKPLAMGEFWYGRDSVTAVRCHGHFYPSCTSKCGPLLKFMMKGIEGVGEEKLNPSHRCSLQKPTGLFADHLRPPIHMAMDSHDFSSPTPSIPAEHNHEFQELSSKNKVVLILFEDQDIVVVEKPAGMPSVPGLDGRESVLEWLNSSERLNRSDRNIYEAVHRLDMDTSGVMVFAKTPEAAVNLRRQFEEHSVRKTYMARLCPADRQYMYDKAGEDYKIERTSDLKAGDKGQIVLPLCADYDERPRQKVDYAQGKNAVTEYEIAGIRPDGCIDIIFHPVTGRTHQLRVHSAHSLGLGRPIVGDLLYGGHSTEWPSAASDYPNRLHLHALCITFRHPATDENLAFSSSLYSF